MNLLDLKRTIRLNYKMNKITHGVVKIFSCVMLFTSCSHLHHVEIGEIDNSKGNLIKVEVMGSETGINVREASKIANAATTSRSFQKASNTVSSVWEMITYGPKTGNVVFSDRYADELPQKLLEACPTHNLTGVTSMRETNKYPVVSGEIVKLSGFCIYPNQGADAQKRGSL